MPGCSRWEIRYVGRLGAGLEVLSSFTSYSVAGVPWYTSTAVRCIQLSRICRYLTVFILAAALTSSVSQSNFAESPSEADK